MKGRSSDRARVLSNLDGEIDQGYNNRDCAYDFANIPEIIEGDTLLLAAA
jgi:hypothetical protein